MKKFFLLLFLCLFSVSVYAEMKVEEFYCDPMDVSARMKKRLDLHKDPCALIKVQMASPEAVFQGNVVGDVEYNVSEYWLYMPKGTQRVKILHPSQTPIMVEFADFDVPALEEGCTYIMKVDLPSNERVVDVEDLMKEGMNKYEAKDYKAAYEIFQKAAGYNSASAMFMMSIMLDGGKGVEQDKTAGTNLCVRAAELGHAQAQYNMGVKCFEGEGVLKDMAKGVEWFKKAAAQGEPNSMYNLGIAHEFGYGVPINLDEAEYWYCQALERKYERAEKALNRVQEKIPAPASDHSNLTLFCVKGNKAYGFTESAWKAIPDEKKKYYEMVGVLMTPDNESPFIVNPRDEDREIDYSTAKEKYGDYLMTESQANFVAEHCEALISCFKTFGMREMEGYYWVRTTDGSTKGLVFAEGGVYATILPVTKKSVCAVRPVINIGQE